MKNIIISLIVLAGMISCSPKGYHINGHFPGAPDSVKVSLMNILVWPNEVMDSTYVIGEKFELTGNVGMPEYVMLRVAPYAKNQPESRESIKAKKFFLENSNINIHCIYDSLPSYFYEMPNKEHNVTITGSAVNDLYESYLAKSKPNKQKTNELWQKYLQVYHRPALEGVFNTKEGVEICRERLKCGEENERLAIEFIKANPKSVAAAFVANTLIARSKSMTLAQMEDVVNTIDSSLTTTAQVGILKETFNRVKNFAVGQKYLDLEFKDMNGKLGRLSEYIKEGEYTMLEFWASWCGPCRGEIPHLKHVYEMCGDKFTIISISVDNNEDEWKKAVGEEGMKWLQLNGEKQSRDVYGVSGVPFCLILDKEGKVISSGLRGAELDRLLIDLGILNL